MCCFLLLGRVRRPSRRLQQRCRGPPACVPPAAKPCHCAWSHAEGCAHPCVRGPFRVILLMRDRSISYFRLLFPIVIICIAFSGTARSCARPSSSCGGTSKGCRGNYASRGDGRGSISDLGWRYCCWPVGEGSLRVSVCIRRTIIRQSARAEFEAARYEHDPQKVRLRGGAKSLQRTFAPGRLCTSANLYQTTDDCLLIDTVRSLSIPPIFPRDDA